MLFFPMGFILAFNSKLISATHKSPSMIKYRRLLSLHEGREVDAGNRSGKAEISYNCMHPVMEVVSNRGKCESGNRAIRILRMLNIREAVLVEIWVKWIEV